MQKWLYFAVFYDFAFSSFKWFWELLVQISGKQVVGMRFFLKNRIRISTITFKILYAKIDLLLCKLEANSVGCFNSIIVFFPVVIKRAIHDYICIPYLNSYLVSITAAFLINLITKRYLSDTSTPNASWRLLKHHFILFKLRMLSFLNNFHFCHNHSWMIIHSRFLCFPIYYLSYKYYTIAAYIVC